MRRKRNSFARPKRAGKRWHRRSTRASIQSRSCYTFTKVCRRRMCASRLTINPRASFRWMEKQILPRWLINLPRRLKRMPVSRIFGSTWLRHESWPTITRNFVWKENRDDGETESCLSANEPARAYDDARRRGNFIPAHQYLHLEM